MEMENKKLKGYKLDCFHRFGITPGTVIHEGEATEFVYCSKRGDVLNEDVRIRALLSYEFFLDHVPVDLYENDEEKSVTLQFENGEKFKYYCSPFEWYNLKGGDYFLVNILKTINAYEYRIVSIREVYMDGSEKEIFSQPAEIEPRITKVRRRREKPYDRKCPPEAIAAEFTVTEYFGTRNDTYHWGFDEGTPQLSEGNPEYMGGNHYRCATYSCVFFSRKDSEEEGVFWDGWNGWVLTEKGIREVDEIVGDYPGYKEFYEYYYDKTFKA